MNRKIYRRAGIIMIALATFAIKSESQTNFICGRQYGSDKDEYVMNHVVDNIGKI